MLVRVCLQFSEAVNDYSEALRLSPKEVECVRLRGDCWYNLGNYENALKDYHLALEMRPQEAKVSFFLYIHIYTFTFIQIKF